jgi:hypothetical protein
LLVFLYFWGVYFPLNFLFFIVHGIQRFSNRCLEIPLLVLGFSWSLGLSSLFSPSLFILVLIIALVVLLILSFFFYLCLSCPDLFCLCPFILILLSSLADFLSLFLPMRNYTLFLIRRFIAQGIFIGFNGLRIIFSFIKFPKLWYALCFEVLI